MKHGEIVEQWAFEQEAIITKPEVPFGQPTDIRTTKFGRIVRPTRRYCYSAV